MDLIICILKNNTNIKNRHILFSESQSRIIITINPSRRKKFENCFEKNQISLIGKVIKSKKIIFKMQKKEKFKININSLVKYLNVLDLIIITRQFIFIIIQMILFM